MSNTQTKMVDVIATRDGHDGRMYRKAGSRFSVPEDQISKRWMVPADSAKAKQFSKALENKDADRDRITGERVASGGLSEQLSVALAENTELKAQVTDLTAQVDKLTAQLGRANGSGSGQAPATPADNVAGGEQDETNDAPTTTTKRRRRSTSK